MRSISTSVLLAWALGATGVIQAREFYVEQKHAQASDKNDGSEAKPLKTIQAAVDLAKPGDMIWVKAGTYEEPVKIAKAGTLAHPITISAWKDDRVCVGSILATCRPRTSGRPFRTAGVGPCNCRRGRLMI